MSSPTKTCRFCGEQMPIGFVHCDHCGQDQDAAPWSTGDDAGSDDPAGDAAIGRADDGFGAEQADRTTTTTAAAAAEQADRTATRNGPPAGPTPATRSARQEAARRRNALDRSRCSHCGAMGSRPGSLELRTGGTSGGWSLLLGGLADLGEAVTSLRTYTCEACGHIDLYAW